MLTMKTPKKNISIIMEYGCYHTLYMNCMNKINIKILYI